MKVALNAEPFLNFSQYSAISKTKKKLIDYVDNVETGILCNLAPPHCIYVELMRELIPLNAHKS